MHGLEAGPLGQQEAAQVAAGADAGGRAVELARVGAWQDSVSTNRRSADAAKQEGDSTSAYHAADYMVYAELQLGQDRAAQQVLAEFQAAGGMALPQLAGPYAAAAMPARLALERGDWATASQLPKSNTSFPFCDAITVFARALGAARRGDADAAEQEAQGLASKHKALLEAKNNYWASEVEVQRLAAAAWIARARGQNETAVQLMRAAADLEDRNEKHIVTPGRVVPARELLGEMLLELKQPAAALREFEQSQLREPNRLRGFAGAAEAAEGAGEPAKARAQYARLVELTRDADTPLPAVARAKTYLATK
jgi:hypothetical protein